MENSFERFSLEKGESTYYGKNTNEVDSNTNSDTYNTHNGTDHLDHLFDNNSHMNYTYDKNTTTSIDHNDNNSYTYNLSNNPSLNNSYNNSPLSTSKKNPIIYNHSSPLSNNIRSPISYNHNNPISPRNNYNNPTNLNNNQNFNNNDNYIDECHDSLVRRIKKLKHFMKNLSTQQNSAVKDAESAKMKITEAAEQMHRIVEEDKEKLLRETDLYAQNTRHELEKMDLEVQKNLKASEEFLKFVEDLKASCPPEQINNHVTSITSMRQQLDKLNHDVTIGSLKFRVSEVGKFNLLGKVSVSDLDTSDPYIDQPLRVGLIEGSQMVAGITTSQDKIYVIRELLSTVEIYNTDLSRHKMLKLEGLRKPSDIAADSLSCHVYISDGSGCVFKLHPETNVLNKLAIDVSGDPQGLYVIPSGADNAGNILVTCSDSKQVKEYTNQGDFVRCIKLQQDVLNPWHCVSLDGAGWGGKVLGEKKFIISHGYESGKLHRICSISDKGKTLSTFGLANGSGSMKLDIPNRIAVDRFGYVFVADRNNDRVVLLSPNLVYVRDIINKFQKIKQPKRLFLDQENGWLYVGLVNGSVHIFQLCDTAPENEAE